jgi:hypothetical protein
MLRDWKKLTIPLGRAGEDPGSDELSRELLTKAENVIFQRDGALTTRPGFNQDRGRMWTTTFTGLPVAGAYGSAGVLPATNVRGLVKVRPGGDEIPLLLTDSRAYHKAGADWHDIGSFWSTKAAQRGFTGRATRLGGGGTVNSLKMSAAAAPVPTVGYLTTSMQVHGEDGQLIAELVPNLTNNPNPGADVFATRLGSDAALVWNTSTNQLCMMWTNNDPHSYLDIVLATDARAANGQFQGAVWDQTSARLFIAYLTTTSTQVKIIAVTNAGAVTGTVTYTHGAAVNDVFINLIDGRLVVAFTSGTNCITKVYSTALVDQAIDVTHVATGGANAAYPTVGPGAASNTAVVTCSSTATASGEIFTRSTTSTTNATIKTFTGAVAPNVDYYPRYAAWRQSMANGQVRCFVGFSVSQGTYADFNHQWFILDVTSPNNDLAYIATLVAQGPSLGSGLQYPSNVDPWFLGTNLMGSSDFVEFDGNGGVIAGFKIFELQFDNQVAVSESAGAWLLGGSTTHYYDGNSITETGYIGIPAVSVTNTAGGSIPAGSYSVLSVWVWTDALGKTHRSAPSDLQTVTVAGGATATITYVLSAFQASKKIGGYIEVYISEVNPPATGVFPLYLADIRENSGGTVTNSLGSLTGLNQFKQVYTTGGTLENYPPPGSDGGIAAAGQRVWVGSGSKVAASKLVKVDDPAPAWNELLEFQLPAQGGDVMALIPEGDGVIVVCQRSIYLIVGDNRDNLLQGQEPDDPVLLSDLGGSGARAWARFPGGIVVQSADFKLYLIDRGGGQERISRPVDIDGTPLSLTPVELIHWPQYDSIVVVQPPTAASFLVWNYRVNAWTRWNVPNINEDQFIGISGDLIEGELWVVGDTYIGSFQEGLTDDTYGVDEVPITGDVETAWIRVDEGRARGWGRVGAATVMGTVHVNGNGSMIVHRDYVRLASPELHGPFPLSTPSGGPTTWPHQRMMPEVRLSRQKCSAVLINFTFTGIISLSELELDIKPVAAAAPPGQRVQ